MTRQTNLTQISPSIKCVDLTMVRTVTLMATISKVIIKKFLVSVCGFMEDAAKEITKNQGYDDL
jgi:hypothetical protein